MTLPEDRDLTPEEDEAAKDAWENEKYNDLRSEYREHLIEQGYDPLTVDEVNDGWTEWLAEAWKEESHKVRWL